MEGEMRGTAGKERDGRGAAVFVAKMTLAAVAGKYPRGVCTGRDGITRDALSREPEPARARRHRRQDGQSPHMPAPQGTR